MIYLLVSRDYNLLVDVASPGVIHDTGFCGDWLCTVVHGCAMCNGHPVVKDILNRYLPVEYRIHNQ